MNVLRASLFACAFRVVVSIIVTDAPPIKPEYKYSYEIVDPTTGDTKSLHEVKHGNVVTGSYSVVDPDGIKRIVDYTADSKHGFKAVIRTEPLNDHQNILNGIPYSSLFQSHNYPYPEPYTFKKVSAPIPVPVQRSDENRQINYFSPGPQPNTDDKFDTGEYFKPNYVHK